MDKDIICDRILQEYDDHDAKVEKERAEKNLHRCCNNSYPELECFEQLGSLYLFSRAAALYWEVKHCPFCGYSCEEEAE